MRIIKKDYLYNDPFNIIFLCGHHLKKDTSDDKREILMKYCSENCSPCQPLILEKKFNFGYNKKYLSYDHIFLNNLTKVEKLTSLFSDKIIILHETISTAAELGLFAGNDSLKSKIYVITPDNISIEEDKISGFIKLAFFKHGDNDQLNEPIIFYPDTIVNKTSEYKSEYYTFFHNNQISSNLGRKIDEIIKPINSSKIIQIRNSKNGIFSSNYNSLDYYIDRNKKIIIISIGQFNLRFFLYSAMCQKECMKELGKSKLLKDHVSYIEDYCYQLLNNSVSHYSGTILKDYTVKCLIKDFPTYTFRESIGLFFYILQAIGYIGIVNEDEKEPEIRKLTFSSSMRSKDENKSLFSNIEKTSFGRLFHE
ncbi:hypothetical protein SAMN02910317_01202 [Ruminococcaceae bacterium FB2012]|nr:hypothetical protein SAMN02910317_01202 [Ruminococcaceae bacterium FB2012]